MAAEGPGERFAECGVPFTEGRDALHQLLGAGVVVRRQHFALEDRKVQLGPGSANWGARACAQRRRVGDGLVALQQRAGRDEMSRCQRSRTRGERSIRLLAHDLVDQPTKRSLASVRLAATKDHRSMHVPGCQVLHGSLALLLVLHTRSLMRGGRECGVTSAASLDTGFLIGAEHVLVRPERLQGHRAAPMGSQSCRPSGNLECHHSDDTVSPASPLQHRGGSEVNAGKKNGPSTSLTCAPRYLYSGGRPRSR
jgi:hypothetical protein